MTGLLFLCCVEFPHLLWFLPPSGISTYLLGNATWKHKRCYPLNFDCSVAEAFPSLHVVKQTFVFPWTDLPSVRHSCKVKAGARENQCEVCAQNNVRKMVTTPVGHILFPEGPFKHLVIDYVDMIKLVHGKRCMLVVTDRFSKWVEATPSKDLGAETAIKFIIREVRECHDLVFRQKLALTTAKHLWEKVTQGLKIKQRLGAVYHPQSQGMIERISSTLKARLKKICVSTKLNWVVALPIVLMSRSTHLTPHEMLTGRPMPAPQLRGPYKGPPLELLQDELKIYMKQLSAISISIYLQEKAREANQDQDLVRPVSPGDQVYVNLFWR